MQLYEMDLSVAIYQGMVTKCNIKINLIPPFLCAVSVCLF